jgi:hypothetical protein
MRVLVFCAKNNHFLILSICENSDEKLPSKSERGTHYHNASSLNECLLSRVWIATTAFGSHLLTSRFLINFGWMLTLNCNFLLQI